MADYQVKSTDTKALSLTKAGVLIGFLKYKSWASFKAEISLTDGDATFQVGPKGFWGTTIEVKHEEKVLLDFEMNWKGQIVLSSRIDGMAQQFVFKQKSLLKNTFVLLSNEEELLIIEPDLKWSKMNFDYQITANDDFEKLEGKELLLLAAVHCANYYITMMASVAVIAMASI